VLVDFLEVFDESMSVRVYFLRGKFSAPSRET